MKYCTNCGQPTKKKICPHCGVKRNRVHKYCGWCGTELNQHAMICTACNESIKPSIISRFFDVINILFSFICVLFVWASITVYEIPSAILLFLCAILSFPTIKKGIRSYTIQHKTKRIILYLVRFLTICILFVISMLIFAPSADATKYKVSEKEAIAAAEAVFHEEVTLKNESSFVLNDATVTYYEQEGNNIIVSVLLDYSAQNGFGGMNRDIYPVRLKFNVLDGKYYDMNGMIIYN